LILVSNCSILQRHGDQKNAGETGIYRPLQGRGPRHRKIGPGWYLPCGDVIVRGDGMRSCRAALGLSPASWRAPAHARTEGLALGHQFDASLGQGTRNLFKNRPAHTTMTEPGSDGDSATNLNPVDGPRRHLGGLRQLGHGHFGQPASGGELATLKNTHQLAI
jgi:hypothetical protein